jgi:hypothetical protein
MTGQASNALQWQIEQRRLELMDIIITIAERESLASAADAAARLAAQFAHTATIARAHAKREKAACV